MARKSSSVSRSSIGEVVGLDQLFGRDFQQIVELSVLEVSRLILADCSPVFVLSKLVDAAVRSWVESSPKFRKQALFVRAIEMEISMEMYRRLRLHVSLVSARLR